MTSTTCRVTAESKNEVLSYNISQSSCAKRYGDAQGTFLPQLHGGRSLYHIIVKKAPTHRATKYLRSRRVLIELSVAMTAALPQCHHDDSSYTQCAECISWRMSVAKRSIEKHVVLPPGRVLGQPTVQDGPVQWRLIYLSYYSLQKWTSGLMRTQPAQTISAL